MFLSKYRSFREHLLRRNSLHCVARLGPGAFEAIGGHVVNVVLSVIGERLPVKGQRFAATDVSGASSPQDKANALRGAEGDHLAELEQSAQLSNPDMCVLTVALPSTELLSTYAESFHGISTTDYAQFGRLFWELQRAASEWVLQQSTVKNSTEFAGREHALWWDEGGKRLRELQSMGVPIVITGQEAWGRSGIAVSQMSNLPATLYSGEPFDDNTGVVVPKRVEDLPAIWAFCGSPEYARLLRIIDHSLKMTYPTLVKVPFDLTHWQKIAAKKYPDGLPEPESDDPTQWLFHGRPEESTAPTKVDVPAPLHVTLARLLGYRWPAELDEKMRLSKRVRTLVKRCDELAKFTDADGIVCIPAVAGERTAADRLLSLLSACGVKPAENLEDWLRDKFFIEHCQVFHQRPFIWHIWDGRCKDGFHALVNYHKLDRKLLEKLIYTHLGDWIARQKAAEERGESGAEGRRQDAEKLQDRLKLILEGQPPYDIFVRWKSIEEQPIGWEPDLNDGVRVNIRPFVTAGVLRKNPKIKWKKDRGKEPERPKEQYPWFWGWDEETVDFMGGPQFDGNRWNDCHYSNEVKLAARSAK